MPSSSAGYSASSQKTAGNLGILKAFVTRELQKCNAASRYRSGQLVALILTGECMKRAIMAATLLALGSGAAYAQSPENDEGLYIGGGVGQFNLEIDGLDGTDEALTRLDDDDTAWQAFIGYRLNPYFALQAAYVDFGAPEDEFETSTGDHGKFGAELSGFAPSVIGILPLG